MSRILVLGAGGMAGHVVALYLAENGHHVEMVSGTHRLNDKTHLLDATNKESLGSFLEEHEYDVVINCIGILVKQSEESKDLAVYLNSYLPHFLETFYKDSMTKVIHLSTDCVFSGKNPPYKEDSPYDGELFYDRTKALGEINNDKDLTFRMSIIGPDTKKSGTGLFNWFYAQKGKVPGFKKAIWNGVTTIELAKAINHAIEKNLTGIYHLVPNQNISKLELLKLFKKVFGRDDIEVEAIDGVALDKTLVNTRSDFSFTVSDYPTMINEMKKWILMHRNIYKHYEGLQ